MYNKRKIVHVDMDAFYAAVEILDNQKLKGLPVIVGGNPDSRSVVCSASYEARKFGVKSAMACSVARRLCPKAIFVKPHMERYREISIQIHSIFRRFTETIEALSLDEAWLDVTENIQNIPSATWIAENIKEMIKSELNLTCSAGVSFNKFLAKIASDEKKPDGLFVITPEYAHQFLHNMEVRKIPGVGKVTEKKLATLNVKFGYQLREKTENFLVDHFGKTGHHLFHIIRGIDHRPVNTDRERKSISVEDTFETDLVFGERLVNELKALIERLVLRLEKNDATGKTLTLKVKFDNFKQITRSMTVDERFLSKEGLFLAFYRKLKDVCSSEFQQKGIRLIGVGVSNLLAANSNNPGQLNFYHLLS